MRRGGASSHQGGTFARSSSRTRHGGRSEEHTSELQSRLHLVCRLLLEKKKKQVRRRLRAELAVTYWASRRSHSPLCPPVTLVTSSSPIAAPAPWPAYQLTQQYSCRPH